MRDLGRGIRDSEVAGSLRVRSLRSGVFTASARSTTMKNNCHAARKRRMVRVRKMASETDKTGRKEEKEGKEAEGLVVHIGAAEVLGEFTVICMCSCHKLCALQV